LIWRIFAQIVGGDEVQLADHALRQRNHHFKRD
jgi:hypothetical protein